MLSPHAKQRSLAMEEKSALVTGVGRGGTFPETNIAPENRPSQKEIIAFQLSNHPFSGAMLVSGRVLHATKHKKWWCQIANEQRLIAMTSWKTCVQVRRIEDHVIKTQPELKVFKCDQL